MVTVMDRCGCHETSVFGHICYARMAAEKRAEDQRTEAIERAKRTREMVNKAIDGAIETHRNWCHKAHVTTVIPRI